jgi:salicylate hydroxylase
VVDIRQTADDVTVFDDKGNSWTADILLGCDGVKSVVRQSLLGDAPRVTGHVVYRAVVDAADMPEDLRINAPVLWAGPHCHLVHYPLRGGKQYNLVVTFHSRESEEWGVRDGSKEEVLSYFKGIHPRPRQMLDKPTSWRRWSTADREPVEKVGQRSHHAGWDAAHPVAQYMAQGACMALEDAVTIGKALRSATATLPAPSRCMSRYVFRVPRGSSGRPVKWGGFITPRASSGRCVICCGKARASRSFIAAWNGCTAGKKITASNRAEALH